MAVSGVSGGSSIYGNRNVLSGLASGLDTESMIENMTKATRAKIAQQKQKKTLLGWKQSAYHSISTPLIEFSKKYMDFQSQTNLLSSSFFDQTIVTSVGKNNALISASGKTTSNVIINGVKELASSASNSGIGSSLKMDLETKEVGMDENITVQDMAGQSLTFKYGDKRYTVSLPQGEDLSTPEKLADALNKKLSETEIAGGEKLSSKLKISVSDDKKKLVFENVDKGNNKLELVGASEKIEKALGLDFGAEGEEEKISISKNKLYTTGEVKQSDLTHQEKMSNFLVGKSITFSVNGQNKSITLLTKEEQAELDKKTSASEKNKAFEELVQKKLDDAFGKDKVKINFTESTAGKGKFSFTTTDSNDILRVEGGTGSLFGKEGALGIEVGDGNRLNTKRSLEQLGIDFSNGEKQKLVINGITVGEYDKDAKLSDIMKDINNNKELGISVRYSETSNKFVLETNETGSNSKIEISGGLSEALFGSASKKGTDAVIDVTVNGERKTLTRQSNDINIDGLTVTVSGKFGKYDESGNLTIDEAENVSFTSKPDTEKVFEAIKGMVEEYNNLIDKLNKELKSKPNRDFQPLTDEQKKEMSKEEIEKWEEKGKEGLLFADSDLRNLHNDLRFIFSPGGEAGAILREIGIEAPDNYKDGGKIKLDEAKLKAALESDPEKVRDAFNAPAPAGSESSNDIDAFKGGVMTRLKAVVDKYASTSLAKPGILVQKAGSPLSANSMLNNAMQQQIQGIDKVLDGLDAKLKKEIDRYNSKFTKLEMLVSQMNAQSGQLAGLMGGGM